VWRPGTCRVCRLGHETCPIFNENQFVATCGRRFTRPGLPVSPVYDQVGTVTNSDSDKVAEGVFSLYSLDGRGISCAFRGLPLRHGLRAV
jgi:hypothetical protein